MNALTPSYPVVNKIKVKNKKISVVPVVPKVTESEKSDTEIITSDDTDNPLFIEGIVRSLLPHIYFTCFIVFLLNNVINISTLNLIESYYFRNYNVYWYASLAFSNS